MATPTKKSAAKSTPKKPAVARKTTAKPAAKKLAVKKQKVVAEQSFRANKETTPFMTFQFTQQSLYWLILSVLVLALGSWVMYLNVKIQNIYDQVELNTYLHETYTIPQKDKSTPTPTPAQQ
jgi:hypothetical protein